LKWIKKCGLLVFIPGKCKKMAGITARIQTGQYRINRHTLFLSLEYADEVRCGKLQPFPTFGRKNIIRITA
jgi:hypothetical protein